MHKRIYYTVNVISFYRLLAAPVLLLLIFIHRPDVFKWLLGASFLSDAIDGSLARRYKTTSRFGSRLDSIADDLTVIAAIAGLVAWKKEFLQQQTVLIAIVIGFFVLQTALAFIRYGRISSFHTYGAKLAAILQGSFFLLMFFLPQPVYILFYATAFVTMAELAEEIILVFLLPKWETDVKGLYWVLKRRKQHSS